jgi:hypothetical protein
MGLSEGAAAKTPDRRNRSLGARRVRSRRRSILALSVAVVLGLILLEQLGVRRLSGEDFPPKEALALDLRRHVEALASPSWGGRKPGTPGNAEAARYLAGELEKAGVLPLPSLGGYLAPVGAPGEDLGSNVIGYLPASAGEGSQGAAEAIAKSGAIVLGAHFDHIGPVGDSVLLGADDNASGVAVLLGSLAPLRREPLKRAILFVFFNTEEPPHFLSPTMGSRRFIASLPAEIPGPASIHLAVILDLMGGVVWKWSADTVFACGAEAVGGLGAIVDKTREDGLSVRRLGLHMVENLPGRSPQPFSDYEAFRSARVPFLFLSSGRTPRYHAPSDLPSTLHYDRMARTSRWIARFIAEVDALPAPLPFDPDLDDLAADRDTMRWAIDAAALPWKSVPGTGPVTAARLLGDRSALRAMSAPDHAFTPADRLALERASFRLQCLLYAYPVCFTF